MSIISLSHSLILFDFNSKYFRFQDTAYQGLSIVYFILLKKTWIGPIVNEKMDWSHRQSLKITTQISMDK